MVIELTDGDDLVIQAVAGELDAAMVGERIPIEGSLGGQVLRSRRAERLADAPARLRFRLAERVGAHTGLLVPLVFRDQAVGVVGGVRPRHRRSRVHAPRTSGSWRRSRPAPRPRSRPPRRSRRRRSNAASRPPSSSAAAGRASCTTTACRSSPRVKLRLGALARVEAGGPARTPSPRRSSTSTRASRRCAASSPTCARPRSTSSASARRWRRSRSAGRALGGHRRQARRRPPVRGGRRADPARAVDRDDDLPRRPGGADQRRQARRRAACQRHGRRARRRGRDRGDRRRTRLRPVSEPTRRLRAHRHARACHASPAGGTTSSRAPARAPRCMRGSRRRGPTRPRPHEPPPADRGRP